MDNLQKLNEEYLKAKAQGKAIEDLVNQAIFLLRQDPSLWDLSLPICQEALHFILKIKETKVIPIIPNFISLVGSTLTNQNHQDIDILIRAERHVNLQPDGTFKDYYLIDANSIRLPIRNFFGKDKDLDFIDSAQGPHGDFIPLFDLVLLSRVEKDFVPAKPRMAGYTESYRVEDLIKWASGEEIAIEPKLNGFRAILEKRGQEIFLWYEGTPHINRIRNFPEIEKELLSFPFQTLILDGDIGIEVEGKRLPRYKLNKLNSQEVPWEENEVPIFTAFDILQIEDEDTKKEPFYKRREKLEKISRFFKKYIRIIESKRAKTEDEIRLYAKWAIQKDMSEGLVAKKIDSSYEEGGTDSWFKLKKVGELKVIVLKKHQKENGFTYEVGLLGGGYENREELKGKTYVNIGETHTTTIDADIGDILTITFLEMIAHPKKNTLTCMNMVVQDIDDTRDQPYTVEQAMQVAENIELLFKSLEGYLYSEVPLTCKIIFLVEKPTKIEEIRQKFLVGGTGKVFKERYLPLFGIQEKDICVIQKAQKNEVPSWIPQIGLGYGAKSAIQIPYPLDDEHYIQAVLPEVKRKSKKIKELIKKNTGLEEGESFTEEWWEENWYKLLPKEGKGEFVYQLHFRGLSEEEINLSLQELLKTNHSVHGDLRLTAEKPFGLWGFTVFEGSTKDIRKVGITRLVTSDSLQGTFKINQPEEWLEVGKKKPFISEPQSVGATSKKYAKFFAIDWGQYEIGVARVHAIELFLKGDLLKGRYLITYTPIEGRRIWLIKKQENETPLAQRLEQEEVIEELKQKGQKYLYWRDPSKNEPAEIIPIRKHVLHIISKEEEKRLVYGVVLEPDVVDAQGDVVDAETIEEASHRYMINYRIMGERHSKIAEGVHIVESYIAPVDFEINGQKIRKGSWILVVYVENDEIWDKIKRKEYVGYSIGGFAIRE